MTALKPTPTRHYVFVLQMGKNQVLVLASLALTFDIDLSGGHTNFLVKKVTHALVHKLVVKFTTTIL